MLLSRAEPNRTDTGRPVPKVYSVGGVPSPYDITEKETSEKLYRILRIGSAWQSLNTAEVERHNDAVRQ